MVLELVCWEVGSRATDGRKEAQARLAKQRLKAEAHTIGRGESSGLGRAKSAALLYTLMRESS